MTSKINTVFLVIGNKTDLKGKRQVTENDVKALVDKCTDANTKIFYADASAKTGEGIYEAFMKLSEVLVKQDRM